MHSTSLFMLKKLLCIGQWRGSLTHVAVPSRECRWLHSQEQNFNCERHVRTATSDISLVPSPLRTLSSTSSAKGAGHETRSLWSIYFQKESGVEPMSYRLSVRKPWFIIIIFPSPIVYGTIPSFWTNWGSLGLLAFSNAANCLFS